MGERHMADVAIARCERYENAEAALLEALAPFGSLDWARPGMKVALKVNVVPAAVLGHIIG